MENALDATMILFNVMGGLGLFFIGVGLLWFVSVYLVNTATARYPGRFYGRSSAGRRWRCSAPPRMSAADPRPASTPPCDAGRDAGGWTRANPLRVLIGDVLQPRYQEAGGMKVASQMQSQPGPPCGLVSSACRSIVLTSNCPCGAMEAWISAPMGFSSGNVKALGGTFG
jgi:hypothetical protein